MSDTAHGLDMLRAVAVLSPAKINWTLEVVGKRPDGFHDITSLVSVVTLYDELVFSERADSRVVLECDVPAIPTDERNLICRAARLLASRGNRPAGVHCRLTKRIPVGGGLGGGSANAATTLRALNDWWHLHWSTDQLAELAAELGSDVPLFLQGGSAVIGGRGERVRPTSLGWTGWLVLLMPGLAVATADVYRAWRPGHSQAGSVVPPSTRSSVEWMQATYNMLEPPAIEVCPALGDLQQQAARIASRPVRISGSGSTLFTAFDERDEATAFARQAGERLGIETAVVQPVEQAPVVAPGPDR